MMESENWVKNAPSLIKEWRSSHKLTIKQLAQILGVHFGTIKKWESGENPPPVYLGFALLYLEQR